MSLVSLKQVELASLYRILSSESDMYHLLIERVSIVTIEFLQYRARVRIGLNRAGIERVVERNGLFTSLTFGFIGPAASNLETMAYLVASIRMII
jgi:hypothetical protein